MMSSDKRFPAYPFCHILLMIDSSLFTVILYSIGVFGVTFLTTSLPLLFHLSKNASKIISHLGVGLMLGTCFIVVLPEAFLRGCECGGEHGGSGTEGHLEAKNIGIAVAIGFITMIVADSLSHGSHEDHHHEEHSHDNELSSDSGKDEVVINMSEMNLKRLRSSLYGLCLHSLFDGLAIGSSISSTNTSVMQTIFWAILLHKVSASLGTGIFIRQLHIPFNQGIIGFSLTL